MSALQKIESVHICELKSWDINVDNVAAADIQKFGVLCRREGRRWATNVPGFEVANGCWGDEATDQGILFAIKILGFSKVLADREALPCTNSTECVYGFFNDILRSMPVEGGRLAFDEVTKWTRRNSNRS